MSNFKYWIHAARLRTLPLSVAGILVGCSMAFEDIKFSSLIFALALLTALSLQILSNLANDLGDFQNKKDTEERIGPERMVHSGKITPGQMSRGVKLMAVVSIILGFSVIFFGSRALDLTKVIVYVILGFGAVIAALKYTMGKNPYGYSAFGDLFVFIFFGLVSVLGVKFLQTHELSWLDTLPAVSIGLLSAGVLNLNNLRDYESDRKTGKFTLVVGLGVEKARLYHTFIVSSGVFVLLMYSFLKPNSSWEDYIYIVTIPWVYMHLIRVLKFTDPIKLIPELMVLSILTLSISILFGLGLILGSL